MQPSPYATKLTREIFEGHRSPSRNMTNGKPYRTAKQKAEARANATKRADGTWRSDAPVSFHPVAR